MEDEFKIDGVSIPSPDLDSYSVERNDIDSASTGRTESGYMYREIVRTKIYKISMKFHVTPDECELLENLLSSANFTLRFMDKSAFKEKTMYCSTFTSTPVCDELYILSCNCQEV